MPRPRRNDPAGFSDCTNMVTDPTREAELVAELSRKVTYLNMAYQLESSLGLERTSYNNSLAKLRKALAQEGGSRGNRERLHPWLELAISRQARTLAKLAGDMPLMAEHGPYVQQAVRDTASRAKLFRGRPGHLMVRRYVLGFMAAAQEATGKPLIAVRDDKDGIYQPQVPGVMGQALRMFVDSLTPGITDSELSYWIRDARKRYAGKPMRFQDMFPGYGMTSDAMTGAPVLQPPYQIERSGIIAPIYCP